MKKKNKEAAEAGKKTSNETKDSVSQGKKAISIQQKISAAKPGRREDKKEKSDARRWRNEG